MHPKHSTSLLMDQFGSLTFHRAVMKKMLPKEVFMNVTAAMDGKERVNPLYADTLASAMKDWAISRGATYFCHWFQPLTGKAAEKHDAFLDIGAKGVLIEKFSGKLLFRGEPDASSFPSGGLRKTAVARGYSSWDSQSAPFLWKVGEVITLYIPAVFFSWCGKALDMKIPLIRSEEKLGAAALRLLHLLGLDAQKVHSTLGCEQEYFLIPKDLLETRPDLKLTGRTLFGASSAKGQELEDHYFSSIPAKVLCFMKDVEDRAFDLGIPLKTRHCEVASQQYEVAPLFEKSVFAVDHNLLLMQLMREVAAQHGFSCLFHEKPFAGINGSGKHCNWSLQTDTGLNLLDPSLLNSTPLLFLSCITAIIAAVYQHSDLLRASIASAANDHRLGGHEAPPALISIYLGEELEKFVEATINQRESTYTAEALKNIQIPFLPDLLLDTIDRNRSSPFVFTGNKFEFRSVGSSSHPAATVLVLNAIVAESLDTLINEVELERNSGVSLQDAFFKVIQKTLVSSSKIRYLGDNYRDEWKSEALARGLPNIEKSLYSFQAFMQEKAEKVFEGILSLEERVARISVLESTYAHVIEQEAKLMIELFSTQILPACLEYQTQLAKNIYRVEKAIGDLSFHSKQLLIHLSEVIQKAMVENKELTSELISAQSQEGSARSFAFCDLVLPRMRSLRREVDILETMVQDTLWPLLKYRELLFSL